MKNGIMVLHKGEGLTSQSAVNRVKRLLGAAKAGQRQPHSDLVKCVSVRP